MSLQEFHLGRSRRSREGRELGRYGIEALQLRIGRTRAPWVVAG